MARLEVCQEDKMSTICGSSTTNLNPLSSIIVYLNYLKTTANTIGEIIDIFKL